LNLATLAAVLGNFLDRIDGHLAALRIESCNCHALHLAVRFVQLGLDALHLSAEPSVLCGQAVNLTLIHATIGLVSLLVGAGLDGVRLIGPLLGGLSCCIDVSDELGFELNDLGLCCGVLAFGLDDDFFALGERLLFGELSVLPMHSLGLELIT